MKRPLLFILTFLILGILISYFINNLYLIIALFIIILFSSLYISKIYSMSFSKYFILFSLIGFYLIQLQNKPYFLDEKQEINTTGYVKSISKTTNDKYKFVLSANHINTNNISYNKKLNILVYSDYLNNIKVGSKINVNGTIYYPNKKSNPSGYDEDLNYKINNIKYKMYANKVDILEHNSLQIYLSNLKDNIFNIYDSILPKTESNIIKAMILGETSFLDDEIIDLYRTSGIYHILSISGLHIGVLALFLTKVFRLISRRFCYIFVIIILIFYCMFTGSSLPTIRATIMCIVVLISNIIYRSPDFISSISLSAIILLFKNPYYLFDIGFLYSYTSVLSIAFLGGRICDLYNIKGIFSAFIVSFFVSLSIKPITAYYFYNFTLLDTFLNIIIIPFVSVVVIIGFLVTFIGMFSIGLAKFLVGCVYYILRFFTYICKVVDNIDFNNIIIGKPSPILIIGLYIMLIFIGYSVYDKYLIRKRKKFINIGIIIFILSLCIATFVPKPLTLTMLDVGQGDSIVGISDDGVFLVDGGGSSNFSVGESVILPYLKSNGVNFIDFVFISHNDTDHIKGIIEILDKINIGNLFVPINISVDENYIQLLNIANERNIPVYTLQNNDKLTLGNNIVFDVLHPNKEFISNDDNDNSLVLRLEYKNNSVLLTGDLENKGEQFLLENNIDLSSDILKVAHHGSKSSTSESFLNKVNPSVALISCKENNIYNHPDKQTIDALTDNNIKIYRTDKNKAITIKFYNNKFKIKCMENNF